MQRMGWGWDEYSALPGFHHRVLKDMIQDEQKKTVHERALAESRARRG